MTRNIESYTSGYLQDYGFEREMVHYRQRLVMERLSMHRPATVLEIGCGEELLARSYYERGGRWDSWVIVEPSSYFASNARQTKLPGLSVIQGFFEEAHSNIPVRAPDMILCSGLLHEVPSAETLIEAVVKTMGAQSILHANVPNAFSMHRQLARAMGMIDDLKTPSLRNKTLDQRRVFEMESLVGLLEGVALNVFERGGYLLKPFTHQQMEEAATILTRPVLDGLFVLGQENPQWASEIFCEARRA